MNYIILIPIFCLVIVVIVDKLEISDLKKKLKVAEFDYKQKNDILINHLKNYKKYIIKMSGDVKKIF